MKILNNKRGEGILFCGERGEAYLTHPARPGKKLGKDTCCCRHCLIESHWHPIMELDNGKIKVIWDEVILNA